VPTRDERRSSVEGPGGKKAGSKDLVVSDLPFPQVPAKEAPGKVITATRWMRSVSIITTVQGQERMNIDVYYIGQGRVSGKVARHNLKKLINAEPLPWGNYWMIATADPLPEVIDESMLTLVQVKLYPNVSNQAPLTFSLEAK